MPLTQQRKASKESRQKSILRGTASSLAKSIHAQQKQDSNKQTKKKPDDNQMNASKHQTISGKTSCLYQFPQSNSKKTLYDNDDDAASQQISSFSDDTPDISADELLSNSSQLSDSTLVEHSSLFDIAIPNYMRRPICSACSRNIKVNALLSSEDSNSSRRSSFSSLKSSSDHSFTAKRTYKTPRCCNLSTNDEITSLKSPSTSPIPTRNTSINAMKQEKWNELLLQQQQQLLFMMEGYNKEQLIEKQSEILETLTSIIVNQQQEQKKSASRLSQLRGKISQWLGNVLGELEYEPIEEDILQSEWNNSNLDILERPW